MKIAVTGASGYSGRYIAKRFLEAGHQVITLTNSPDRENPFGEKVRVFPFNFENPTQLKESLRGVDVLINNYWVRFNYKWFSHEQAVANAKILFQAAKQSGVRRIIHVSITNPDIHSELSYFRGKAEMEVALQDLGVSYCILRPAVLFGKEDVLINNIAWALRRLPTFGVFGDGNYKLQPIYVDDMAEAIVEKSKNDINEIVNAIGPETFTYRGLVQEIGKALELKRPIMSMPPALGYWACRLLGAIVHDVIITRDEIRGFMENRLFVQAPPLGTTRLSEWLVENSQTLGRRYTSELARRRPPPRC